MAQRKNKERKTNLNTYKQNHKKETMSENNTTNPLPQFKPFRQVPTWGPDSKFTLSSQEFDILQSFFNQFLQPIQVVENLFKRGVDEGQIKFKYVDEQNQEVDPKEVQLYLEKVQEYLKSNAANEPVAEINAEVPEQEQPVKTTAKRKLKVVKETAE